jgi:hypothetical protein
MGAPSCGARRMVDTAAHLVDRVFQEVLVRQWVLTLPYALHFRMAYDSRLVSEVHRIFVQAVFASLRRKSGNDKTAVFVCILHSISHIDHLFYAGTIVTY